MHGTRRELDQDSGNRVQGHGILGMCQRHFTHITTILFFLVSKNSYSRSFVLLLFCFDSEIQMMNLRSDVFFVGHQDPPRTLCPILSSLKGGQGGMGGVLCRQGKVGREDKQKRYQVLQRTPRVCQFVPFSFPARSFWVVRWGHLSFFLPR